VVAEVAEIKVEVAVLVVYAAQLAQLVAAEL
jgi:hypothetical protein